MKCRRTMLPASASALCPHAQLFIYSVRHSIQINPRFSSLFLQERLGTKMSELVRTVAKCEIPEYRCAESASVILIISDSPVQWVWRGVDEPEVACDEGKLTC